MPKVLDFGIATLRATPDDTATRLTAEGEASGTPGYVAPELTAGEGGYDERVDIYALGCVGYWLLTGKLVFEAPTAMKMLLHHVQTMPVPPSKRTELPIPESLERVILACLEKDPNQRPAGALELRRQLAACELSDTWTAERAERWWRTHRPTQRNVARPPSTPGSA